MTKLGDRVWLDLDANGIQDGGEPGVEGVEVQLFSTPSPPFFQGLAVPDDTTTTDENGFYFFDLQSGDYYLRFSCNSVDFTLRDQGDDALDSDVNPASATTPAFHLDVGDYDNTRDAGLLDPDADGVACADNCPDDPNADQADADEDAAGDVCDTCTDTDDDGFGNPGFDANTCATDNCPDDPNADQADADEDGVGDACDLCTGDDATGDSDSDGVCDDLDCDDGDPTNACAVIFNDGFESGDTSAWSQTVD